MAATLVEHVVADAAAFLKKAPLQVSLTLLRYSGRRRTGGGAAEVGTVRESGRRERGAPREGGRQRAADSQHNLRRN